MSQASCVMPTSGIVSGVTMATDINAALDALRTMFSGASSPTADAPEEGQWWLNTNTTPKTIELYDGAQFVPVFYLDDVNHSLISILGGQSATVASGATVSLGAAANPNTNVSISGTTTITSFGNSAQPGQIFVLTFQAALTLTYNSTSLILPGKANIVTAANDVAIMQYLGSSNWQCLLYQPVATLLGSVGTVTGAFITNNVVSPAQITGNQNNYSPTGMVNAAVLELTSDGLADYVITGMATGVSGRQLEVRNANTAGGGRFIFVNASTLSSTGNRFVMPGVVSINPNQQAAFIYDNSASAWAPRNAVGAQPVQTTFKNLRCGNAGKNNFTAPGTPNTQFKIAADYLMLADTDGNTVNLNSVSVTATITSTGANGLDSYAGVGLAANQWYSQWVIFNPITNTAAALMSTTVSAPTMPSGYTFKARCSWAITDGASNLKTSFQQGREWHWVVGASTTVGGFPQLSSGSAGNVSTPTWVVLGTANVLPPTASAIDFQVALFNANANIMIAPSTLYGAIESTANPPPSQFINITIQNSRQALESTTVYYASNIGLGAGGGQIYSLGYVDNL